MKNLKMRNKLLLGSSVLVIMMVVIAAMSILGLRALHGQNSTLINKTLANTSYVWEMRRNLISEQRYELMALADDDRQACLEWLNSAQEEVDKNAVLLETYKQNYRVDASKVSELESYFNAEAAPRAEMLALLKQETEEADEAAFQIFHDELKPLLDKQAELLADIGSDQDDLAIAQVAAGQRTYQGTMIITIALIVLAIVVSAAIAFRLIRLITSPLLEIENAARSLSNGDFETHITYESKDEMGSTCKSMQESFTILKSIIMDINSVLGALSRGDLSVATSVDFPGEMQEIETSIAKLIQKLNLSFGEIRGAADQINSGAEQVSNGAQALAQGATEQASSVEELAATITEISRQVQTNSENAQKANVIAADAGKVADMTLEGMREMIAAMQEIMTTSENIGKIIKVIDDIAFQTNILALNAAVEAARAGSAGKGFAVVADEVRNLAGKSADAAKSTTELIDSTIKAVSHGEEIAGKANAAFEELSAKVSEVVSTVNMISEASTEQAANIQQITVGVDQISSVVQTNSATSEESAAASEELAGQASTLDRLVAQFKLADKPVQRQAREELPASDGNGNHWQEAYPVGDKY
ncbi:methyl-accepting chemotaxis protein [Agathobaculum sp. LCP25S3_E8]|uniref:methyl-accepting chemotaxis protein n=1 Tax=Agathobaculum sp. LCP25S3_E8 TaxID=3438735 RepID=UPI003F92FBEE